MSDFLLGMSVTLFVMVFLNHKFQFKESLKKRNTLILIAAIALILSIIFSLEEIVRGVKDSLDFRIQNTNSVIT